MGSRAAWLELTNVYVLSWPLKFLTPRKGRLVTLASLKRWMDSVVFASALLGLLLLYEAAPLVPRWLLASLATGEAAYAICALGVARGVRGAYFAILALAFLVLAVSLPQPAHYAFATSGDIGAFAIFAIGSLLQGSLLVMIPVYLRRTRRR